MNAAASAAMSCQRCGHPVSQCPTDTETGLSFNAATPMATRPKGTPHRHKSIIRRSVTSAAVPAAVIVALVGFEMARPAMATVGDRAPSSLPLSYPAAEVAGGPVAFSTPPSGALSDDAVVAVIGGKLRRAPAADAWIISQIHSVVPDSVACPDDPSEVATKFKQQCAGVVTNDRTTGRAFTELGAHGD